MPKVDAIDPVAVKAQIASRCSALKIALSVGSVGVLRLIDDLHVIFYAKAALGDAVLAAAANGLRDSIIAAIPVAERGKNIDRLLTPLSPESIAIRAQLDGIIAVP